MKIESIEVYRPSCLLPGVSPDGAKTTATVGSLKLEDTLLPRGVSLKPNKKGKKRIQFTAYLNALAQAKTSPAITNDLKVNDGWYCGLSGSFDYLEGIDLADKPLLGLSLINEGDNKINLRRSNFTYTDLKEANLSTSDLTDANFTNANLNLAILSKTILANANFTNANLSKAILGFANLNKANCTKANLSNADLSFADLADANFTNANLSKAILDFANLNKANCTKANLSNADLSFADLADANFTNAILISAGLSCKNFENADFTRANLANAYFHASKNPYKAKNLDLASDLSGVRYLDLRLFPHIKLPANTKLGEGSFTAESFEQMLQNNDNLLASSKQLRINKETKEFWEKLVTNQDFTHKGNSFDRILAGLIKNKDIKLIEELLRASLDNEQSISSHVRALLFLAKQESVNELYRFLLSDFAEPFQCQSHLTVFCLEAIASYFFRPNNEVGKVFLQAKRSISLDDLPLRAKTISNLILHESNPIIRAKRSNALSGSFFHIHINELFDDFITHSKPAELKKLLIILSELISFNNFFLMDVLDNYKKGTKNIAQLSNIRLSGILTPRLPQYLEALGPTQKKNLTTKINFQCSAPEGKLSQAKDLVKKLGLEGEVKDFFIDTQAKANEAFLRYLEFELLTAKATFLNKEIKNILPKSNYTEKLRDLSHEQNKQMTLLVKYIEKASLANKTVLISLLDKQLSGENLKNWLLAVAQPWSKKLQKIKPNFKPEKMRSQFEHKTPTGSLLVEADCLAMIELSHQLNTYSCLALGGSNVQKIGTILTNANVSLVWVKDKEGRK